MHLIIVTQLCMRGNCTLCELIKFWIFWEKFSRARKSHLVYSQLNVLEVDGEKGYQAFRNSKFDLCILDVMMPIKDGFDVLRYFKEKRIYQKVIIFSSYDDLKIVQEALSLGCYGYVTKKSASEHIIDAIKTVAKGEQYFSDDIKNILLKTFTNQVTETGELPDKIIIESLTDRELEVLKYIAYEYNSGEIAEKMNLSVSTIDTYRKSLLKKLNVKNSVGIAMYAVRNKLI